MKKTSKISIFALSLLVLSGCTSTTSASASESVQPSTEPSVSDSASTSTSESTSSEIQTISSAREGFMLLTDSSSRFRLNVSRTSEPDGGIEYLSQSFYFAKDYYVVEDDPTLENPIDTGYLAENGGVSSFTFNINSEKLVRSELLTDNDGELYTNLSDVAPSFSKISISDVSETEDGALDLGSKKKVALAMLSLFGIDPSNYFYLVYFHCYLESNLMNGLRFEAKFSTNNGTSVPDTPSSVYYYTANISRFGTAKLYYMEDFLENPLPAFTPTADEKRIRSLFANKNYTQYRDNDGDDTIDQFDYFTDQYYWVEFTDAYAASSQEAAFTAAQYGNRGYLAIANKVMEYSGQFLVFLGTYIIQSLDKGETLSIITRQDPSNPYYAQSSFTQIYTDVSKVLNYPGYMSCLNDFQTAEVADNGDITFTDIDILIDFINNFNLGDTITSYALSPEKLEISPVMSENDEDCEITFTLRFKDSQTCAEYIFKDFGNTKVDLVDTYIEENELAM
ncbi:MAG: hypothetical protein WCR67_06480 [Bacilli bacterium]